MFGSSFTLDTAGAAGADHDDKDVPETVWSLVDRSLVIADLTANATRYRLLEVVRTYARARLEESGDVEEVALNVARHFLDRFGPWLPAGVTWVGGVADEIDNVRSLIPLIAAKEQHVAQQLAYVIGRFHDSTHAFGEGIEELTRYVDALRDPTPTRSSMLNMLAYLHLRTGEVEAAGILVDQAATLRSNNGAPAWDDVGVDRTMGEIARRRGELERAIDIAHSTLRRDLSDRGRSRMLNLLGTTSGALGDLETAYEALSQELELNRALGYDEYVAVSEGNLAETALRMGDFRRAARHQLACLELAGAQTIEPMLAFSMLVAAQLAGRGEDWKKAVTLQTCAERLLDEIGLVLYEDDRAQLDALVMSATTALGGDGVESSRAAGMAMTVPDGVRLASDVLGAASHESDR